MIEKVYSKSLIGRGDWSISEDYDRHTILKEEVHTTRRLFHLSPLLLNMSTGVHLPGYEGWINTEFRVSMWEFYLKMCLIGLLQYGSENKS